MAKAVAYFRTSSAANVGQDKDSLTRQQLAVRGYAAAQGIEIVSEHYDAAVSGADPVDGRPGFAAMLGAMADADMILVENASRFARDLMVQEVGHAMLTKSGVKLVAVDSPESFLSDTPTAVMVRQILGAVSQFEKANLVAKLRAARERSGKLGGRKPAPEAHQTLARSLAASGVSLRGIAAELASAGFLNASGATYAPSSIQSMIH